jgi:hypothetical protein
MSHSHSHAMHGCGCLPPPPMRHCRKEAKELLVLDKRDTPGGTAPPTNQVGQGDAIIGGGCCVSLSVEYMPANVSLNNQVCTVTVQVVDSEGATLVWKKQFSEGYHVKECIITTYPGAKLQVAVANAIARVRWCEVFSC